MKRINKIGKKGLVIIAVLMVSAIIVSAGLMTYLFADTHQISATQKDWEVKREMLTTMPTNFATWISTGTTLIPADLSMTYSMEPGETVRIFYAVACDVGEGIDDAIFEPTVTIVDGEFTYAFYDWNGTTPKTTFTGSDYTGGERVLFELQITCDEWVLTGTFDVDIDLGLPTLV